MIVPQLSLAVVTCNAPQSAVRTVKSSEMPLSRVVVISNGSCAEADAELAKALPGVTLERVNPPRGLTYCLNAGLRLPVERDWSPRPEWFILTQDDVEFDRGWFVKLRDFAASRRQLMQINMAYPKGSYSCIAIRRDLIKQIGWWDERFTGMFFEDDDWHLRLCEFAKCAPGTRVHEGDVDGIFGRLKCAKHNKAIHAARAKDRSRFGFKTALSKETNREFFYRKWACVPSGGWLDKGLPGLFARRLPEINPYPGVAL